MRKSLFTFIIPALFVSAQALSEAPKTSEKEWTLLVFLNGHNNLDSFGDLNVNQMEKIGSSDKVNVVVQWASLKGGTTKRLYIQKDSDDQRVTSPVVEDMGAPADMGDAKTLEDFVKWGVQHYPAKHYMVDVWNHGGGWHLTAKRSSQGIGIQDISWDDLSGNHITTEQFGAAMVNVARMLKRKIDIVSADACLMAMAEVIGEMVDAADYFVASEEVEPGAGWPYDAFLSRWYAASNPTPRDVGRFLVEEYIASYQGGSNGRQEVVLSALDLSQVANLGREMNTLGGLLVKLNADQARKVREAMSYTQSFTYSDYLDLGHFSVQLEKLRFLSLDGALKRVRAAVQKVAYANGVTSGYSDSMGLSFWMPRDSYTLSNYIERFNKLRWGQMTQWGQTLTQLVANWGKQPRKLEVSMK